MGAAPFEFKGAVFSGPDKSEENSRFLTPLEKRGFDFIT
jgi:hypothetical protein